MKVTVNCKLTEEQRKAAAEWLMMIALFDLVDQGLLTTGEAELARRLYLKRKAEEEHKEQNQI